MAFRGLSLRIRVFILAVSLAVSAVGCGGSETIDDKGDGSKISVVVSVFPLALAAKAVGGNLVEVLDLTPPGVEPHDLELTTDQVDALADADLALMMGNDFQPDLEEVAKKREGPTKAMMEIAAVSGASADAGFDKSLKGDPHVWLDPSRMMAIANEIKDALGEIDPGNKAEYVSNYESYSQELEALDARFSDALKNCKRRTIVVAHEAFGWLATRYGLTQLSLAGRSPEQEPDPRQIAELANRMRDEGITTVFTEPLAPKDVAKTLANEANARVAILDPLEVLYPDHKEGNRKEATYRSVMEANLEALVVALDCDQT